ncbi:hypothetical protein DMA15_26645 [Streptomyces sp. WAC 01529]|uniref:hypothetical protein n=1 Tax=Streptomyces sp. WAC 01529 TaxID=2203205 RepID=UPI000F6CCFB4|nr:hypothetical protein [Streptomyces sp. WAC 01529]AZM55724.1 hypothetical protein DMA15_26645 [Streptomyces sp. WAC 01529]
MGEDQEDGRGGQVRKHVGWWIAALAGLAGIAGLIFAIVGKDEFTIKEWAKEANAACDAMHGDIVRENRDANTSLDTLADGGYQSSDYQAAATAWDALSSSERKLTSEMGKIETPNSREKDIHRLLEGMNDISDEDHSLAEELRNEVITGDSQFVKDAHARRAELVAQVNNDLETLNVRHCLANE